MQCFVILQSSYFFHLMFYLSISIMLHPHLWLPRQLKKQLKTIERRKNLYFFPFIPTGEKKKKKRIRINHSSLDRIENRNQYYKCSGCLVICLPGSQSDNDSQPKRITEQNVQEDEDQWTALFQYSNCSLFLFFFQSLMYLAIASQTETI